MGIKNKTFKDNICSRVCTDIGTQRSQVVRQTSDLFSCTANASPADHVNGQTAFIFMYKR